MTHLMAVVAHSIHRHIHSQLSCHWLPKSIPVWMKFGELSAKKVQSQTMQKGSTTTYLLDVFTICKRYLGFSALALCSVTALNFKCPTWPWQWPVHRRSGHECSVGDRSPAQTWASLWGGQGNITFVSHSVFWYCYFIFCTLHYCLLVMFVIHKV